MPNPSDFEASLRSIHPRSSTIDPDELIYQAGREAAKSEAATCKRISIGLSACFIISTAFNLAFLTGEPAQAPPIIASEQPTPTNEAPTRPVDRTFDPSSIVPASLDYLRLQREVMDRGMNALPPARSTTGNNALPLPLKSRI